MVGQHFTIEDNQIIHLWFFASQLFVYLILINFLLFAQFFPKHSSYKFMVRRTT